MQFDNWIGGRSVAPASGEYASVVSPATLTVVAHVALGGPGDIARAAAEASSAQRLWTGRSARERGRVLKAVAAAIGHHRDEFIDLDVSESGKLADNVSRELDVAIAYFDYYGGLAPALHGRTIDQGSGALTYVLRQPLGVVGIITPWNFSLIQTSRGAAPGLAAGNAIMVKPSEFTPLTALHLGRIATDAGLPDGLLNVVCGTGPEAGAALAETEAVTKLVFTGSVSTGQLLGAVAARRIIPITLELGGKSPLIVFDDADLEAAASAGIKAITANSGQVCAATTRILVQRQAIEPFLERLLAGLRGLAPGKDFGPIITEPQYRKVQDYFAIASEEGAVLQTGGRVSEPDSDRPGYFVEPTVYTDVTNDMRIAREEIFGPVAVIIAFDNEAEVLALANDTDYGLVAHVWSGDLARGLRLAEGIEAGQVSVNGGSLNVETPFGGYKQSGHGREKGLEGLFEYTQVKTVSVNLGPTSLRS